MIERVKGISQVNPVSLGTGGLGDRQSSRNDENSAFHNLLTRAMKKKNATPVAETYKLDLGQVTHSLFYQGIASLEAVKRF